MKKNVTPAVLAANRRNAAKSSGPVSASGKLTVSRNAVKHGLLAIRLQFRSEEEKSAFEELLNQLVQEHMPQGVLECCVVEEIAACLWKIATAGELETREVRIRDRTTKLILKAFAEQCSDNLVFGEEEVRNKLGGLECKELLLRMAVAEKETSSLFGDEEDEEKRERTLVGARLGSSLDTTLRYTASLKRDLYRAMDKLQALQHSRTTEGKTKGP